MYILPPFFVYYIFNIHLNTFLTNSELPANFVDQINEKKISFSVVQNSLLVGFIT